MNPRTTLALADVEQALVYCEIALGYDSVDGPAAHNILWAADRLRIARRNLRSELGLDNIPFPAKEIA